MDLQQSVKELKAKLTSEILMKDLATVEAGTRGCKSAAFRIRRATKLLEKIGKDFRKASIEAYR